MAGSTAPRTTATRTRAAAGSKTTSAAAKKPAVAKKATVTKKPAVTKKAAVTKKPAVAKKAAAAATPAKKAAPKKVAAKTPSSARAAASKTTAKKAAPARTVSPTAPVAAPEVLRVIDEPTSAPVAAKGISKHRRLLVGAAAALVLVLVGGAAFALRDPAPSKASYITKADEICRPGNGPVTSIVKPTSYPELSAASDTVAKTTNSEIEQLNRLRRPAGDNGTEANAAIDALSTYRGAANSLRDAAEKKDATATITATKSLQTAFADAKAKTKAFGFSACGSGMEPGIDTTVAGASAVIKTEYTAKADGLCRAAATKMEALPLTPDSQAGLIADLNNSLEITQKLVADLRAIPTAPGDEDAVKKMLDAADKLNAKTVELRDAVAADDFGRFQAVLKEAGPISTESNHEFDAYGLGVCGSNFGN